MATSDKSRLASLLDVEHLRWNDVVYETVRSLVLAFILGVSIIPLVFIFFTTFKSPVEVFVQEVYWIPREPTLQAWTSGFDAISTPLQHSAMVAVGTTIISLSVTIPGAYVLARREFPGRKFFFYLIVIALLFPYILLIIPIVDAWIDLGFYNTIPGLWIAYQVFVAPFAIWILRDFFSKLPADLEEAAQVYGCTPFGAFIRVILPLSIPGILAVGFMAFLIAWNDFLFANMLLQADNQTAIVALFKATQGGERTYWGRLMATTLIIGTPPTVLYMIARKQLTSAFAM